MSHSCDFAEPCRGYRGLLADRDELQREIERLRASNAAMLSLLKRFNCPGGGWNGMPEDMDPTIENCMQHDACGCVYGDMIRRSAD